MKFSEKLNTYMEELSCSAKELGNLSGISGASFSRYRSGERVPEMGTKPFETLCSAIAEIAAQKNLPDITADSVKNHFWLARILLLPIRKFYGRISIRLLRHSISI